MKVLFDHGTPAPLREELKGHEVVLAREQGLDTLTNGEFLDAAEASGYQVVVTTDKGIPYQQNLVRSKLAIVIVEANWPRLKEQLPLIRQAVDKAKPGECIVVSATGASRQPMARKGRSHSPRQL